MKIVTLRRSSEFRRVYSRGRVFSSPIVVMYAIKSRIKEVRVGISASKKVGNAVVRNRARRVMREAWFELVSRIPKGFDFVLSARANTVSVKTKDVQRKIFAFLKKFGLSGL